jgi:hypothetical protein
MEETICICHQRTSVSMMNLSWRCIGNLDEKNEQLLTHCHLDAVVFQTTLFHLKLLIGSLKYDPT